MAGLLAQVVLQQQLNKEEPRIMHIDLNSCFAIIEQQANRLLRNHPVAIAAYNTPRGFIIASSYQAKAKGVKLGVNCAEAKVLCPGITILTPDPAKYREAHRRFKKILLNYSDKVTPKSIDEFILDLNHSPAIRAGQTPEQIGLQIKQDIANSLGEAVTVNVGISTNRFLAKYAAGFGKPDGMTTITHHNLTAMLTDMDLVDLPGINLRYRRRLHMAGIMTPLDFLAADELKLKRQVFKSVVGSHWYNRMRGFEVDDRSFERRSIGHQYALSNKTDDRAELARLLMKLTEKVGRRLRKNNYYANGIHLYLSFEQLKDGLPESVKRRYGYSYSPNQRPVNLPGGFETMAYLRSWHQGRKLDHRLYSSRDIYLAAKQLLDIADIPTNVKILAVNVYDLHPWDPEQLNLFAEDKTLAANKNLSDAVDYINNRYGEFVITPATMADMQGTILDRIAFGSVSDL